MNQWSIKTKLLGLSGSLLGLALLIGGVEFYAGNKISEMLTKVTDVELPAVHNMTLVDMVHDGIKGSVYEAIYLAEGKDSKAKSDLAAGFKESAEKMKAHMKVIDELPINQETRRSIELAQPAIEAYVSAGEAVVGLALSGQRDLAIEKLPDFETRFSDLEEKLEKLGSQIEADAQKTGDEGHQLQREMKVSSTAILVIGLFLGALGSVLLVRNLVKTLSRLIEDLKNSSREVSSASLSSSSAATQLSEAATEQAASLQETMASLEEISTMVSQNAESASKAKSAVDLNQHATEEGTRSVGEMMSAIDEIKKTNESILSQMEDSNREFGEIVKIISEIGDRTKVINDIVFQTKLLSFNASVEAARAGEHGKGFAVVAEEVGNLAQMSGNAAKQISDMLSESIKKVNGIVDQTTKRVDHLVELGKDKIIMGQSTAQKCREALLKIAENARTVTTMVSEITHASKEQAQGIQEINKAIGQLDQVTQQNSSVAQQSSTQAEQLNGEAGKLASLVTTLVVIVSGNEEHPASTESVSNVVPMKKTKVTAAQKPLRKASGSDVIPSESDPGFEEF